MKLRAKHKRLAVAMLLVTENTDDLITAQHTSIIHSNIKTSHCYHVGIINSGKLKVSI
jgi:hypothetical protein